ncbi:glycine oxidase ThiO [Hydrogenovibrio marinus]|uniref:D-amino-acid oxidase n=1 Tax=Hydrogenovibrio marinus TaxID=28885 RepID=A0A066ZUI2_HYDMR|nr:glycine oxidase ThiO [Hydrogenovibrio marinus]KDN95939.1 FAD-dependent oxidoreductase [Hydrogenovibrio marinus]BBN58569.1 glycine oxidase ThiO [Hydrogenovibrio marinus]
MNIGIAGAGLVGRVLALMVLNRGHQVTLFDLDTAEGENAAGLTAAGMLAPFAELETAESAIFESGQRSIALWPELLEQVGLDAASSAFQRKGSIITAHPADEAELETFIRQLRAKVPAAADIQTLNQQQIAELEPDLSHHKKGFFLPAEGQVNAQAFMAASANYLLSHANVVWHQQMEVSAVSHGTITTKDGISTSTTTESFDWVFDSRGLGAKTDVKDLRGVRGEVFWLDAPGVNISRPVRLMHPRYRIYIVPRPDNRYVVGATEIESEDKSPMSVRSSLELLSAVYSVNSAFGEARIVKQLTNCRPALKDNLPRVEVEKGLTRVNGLYRHGYLLSPAMAEQAINQSFGESF